MSKVSGISLIFHGADDSSFAIPRDFQILADIWRKTLGSGTLPKALGTTNFPSGKGAKGLIVGRLVIMTYSRGQTKSTIVISRQPINFLAI